MSRFVAIVEDHNSTSAVEGNHIVEVQEFRHAAEFVIEIINELVKIQHFSKCSAKIIDMDSMKVVAIARNYNRALQLDATTEDDALHGQVPFTTTGLPYISEGRTRPGTVTFATWS